MIVSVPWPATPGVTRDLVERGVMVLAETPPALPHHPIAGYVLLVVLIMIDVVLTRGLLWP